MHSGATDRLHFLQLLLGSRRKYILFLLSDYLCYDKYAVTVFLLQIVKYFQHDMTSMTNLQLFSDGPS